MEEDTDREWTIKELGEAVQTLTLVMTAHDQALERLIKIVVEAGLLDTKNTKH